jgi:hypothetical protein
MAPVMQWAYSPWVERIQLHSGGEMIAALQAPVAVLCDAVCHSWGLYACLLNPMEEMADIRTRVGGSKTHRYWTWGRNCNSCNESIFKPRLNELDSVLHSLFGLGAAGSLVFEVVGGNAGIENI